MDPEVKTEWVKRLRDGRQQTTTLLERVDRFEDSQVVGQCCLGVLGEILHERGELIRGVRSISRAAIYGYNEISANPYKLPYATLHEDIQTKYAGMNDKGARFSEIADTIEKDEEL